MACQRSDVIEGLKRVYVIGLCHYHERNMPSLTHWSQNKRGDKQKVWNKTHPQAKPYLDYPTPTWPSDTSKRNWVGPGIKAEPTSFSLWGCTISSLCVSYLPLQFLVVNIWLAQFEFSGHLSQSLMARSGLWWPADSSAGTWDQPEIHRVGYLHIVSAMCRPGAWWPSKIVY